jgi:hypothetical protein
MGSTILQLAQQAMPEMNLASPTSLFSSGIQDNLTVAALFNAVGYELSREFDWNELITRFQFTVPYVSLVCTVNDNSAQLSTTPSGGLAIGWAAQGTGIPNDTYVSGINSLVVTLTQPLTGVVNGAQETVTFSQVAFPLPADYDRQMNRTQWDKSKHWEMLGPETQQQWQWLLSGYISTGPRIRWTMMGGKFNIWPPTTPSSGTENELLALQYMSKNWAATTLGVAQAGFQNDSDTCVFPDRLMVLGLKKKYFELKSFDSTAFTRDYQMHLSIAKAANYGAANLSFAPQNSQVLISIAQIPDTGYGS